MAAATTTALEIAQRGLPASSGPRKRVVIVGAGIAGLAAAEALLRAGHDPVLLEAQQRVGGRIYTMRAPFSHGLYAEAGAMRIPRATTARNRSRTAAAPTSPSSCATAE